MTTRAGRVPRRPPRRRWAALAIVSLAAVALILKEAAASRPRASPPSFGRVPAFSLTDQEGRPVSLDALRGSVWVAGFIFTRCAGQCPLITQEMARLAEEFRSVPSVRFVSFSVDPDYDRPAVLADYATHQRAATDRWAFVTGAQAEVWALCRDGFRLAVGENPADASEPVTHSLRLVLVDGEARIRGYYDAGEPDRLARLREDLKALVAR